MDWQHIVAGDPDLLRELLDRQDGLVTSPRRGLEAMEIAPASGSDAPATIERMREGTYSAGEAGGLEAIVLRFTRPVFLVRGGEIAPPVDAAFAGGESAVIASRLATGKSGLDAAIPAVGRIDLVNHRRAWAGTGWVVHPEIVVTNRHVAQEFAAAHRRGFRFRRAGWGRRVGANIDWRHEYGTADASVVRVEEVLWIEPEGGPDLALLRVSAGAGLRPIPLMSQTQVDSALGNWVAVIGYPAHSSENDHADQERIFDGIYDVKRLAPGTVTTVSADGRIDHDATTLGGNSGSVVLDLATGLAVGLHFGGFEGARNMAVAAPVITDRIEQLT